MTAARVEPILSSTDVLDANEEFGMRRSLRGVEQSPLAGHFDQTIVAPATASGAAGLAVVRLSGAGAVAIGARLFRGADLLQSDSHRAHHGFVVDAADTRIDEVLALVLRAPASYTGEDTVEFSCHGSAQVVDEIVDTALRAGARLAEPGEFTRRAFLNGKLDLSQAEAVADLIAAQTRAARRAALEQLRGRLSARVRDARDTLLAMLAEIEAGIDFVEEDIEFLARDEAERRGRSAAEMIAALLATADEGVHLRSGIRVSLAGAPNVGKSSLFNALVRSPRAIVTEHAGTTRDVVHETLRLGGVLMQLEDTAGLRAATADPVEAIGIERSRRSHREADIVLLVLDAARALQAEEAAAIHDAAPGTIVALNKVDLLPPAMRDGTQAAATWVREQGGRLPAGIEAVAVSAQTRAGVDALTEALGRQVVAQRLVLQNDGLVAINQRHREILLRAEHAVVTFMASLEADEPAEILAADLRRAVGVLGEISGEQVSEEILDAIFSRFCIGK